MKTLLLPIGGSASRMLGLPKFLLPFDRHNTLIGMHIQGAWDAGFRSIAVIVHPNFADIVRYYLEGLGIPDINLYALPRPTSTMNETIHALFSSDSLNLHEHIVVALADSAFSDISYSQIYSGVLNSSKDFSLSLFNIRSDQVGKLGQVSLDSHNVVVDIQDKHPTCHYPQIWGMASFPISFSSEIDSTESHIGISLARYLKQGGTIHGISSQARYFDCGTFDEYKLFLCSS